MLAFIAEVTQPVFLPNGAITDAGTLEWLNDYLDRLVRDYDLSGSALVAIGERVVFERVFGFEDVARSRPVTASTHFNLASASKMFTALAVARLVADGKLSYADPIDRFFPDFPDRAHARATTVAHLLSHTSGVGEYWTAETDAALRDVRNTADVYPFVVRAGVRFAPGTRHEYSNSNFILAGLIVERVSGTSYETFVARLVTTPLGMKDTGPFVAGERGRSLAEAMTRADTGWSAVPRRGRGTAAGGWWSTARDMHRFLRGVAAGGVVPAAALDTMRVSRTAAIPGSDGDYGYGLILQRSGGTDSYGHGGTARGVNAEVRHFPALDATLVVFSNQDNGAYDDLRRTLTRLITGER
jgi:CubicO group peptidase (beta-lactamase class C family)